jgi:putative NIF3 family GTP cyclohydrolase 1 type 2
LRRAAVSGQTTRPVRVNIALTMKYLSAALLTMTLAAAYCLSARAQGDTLTARDVVEAIQHELPGDWDPPTVDTFKAGNPDTPVTGIAVTMMATMEVLQRAAARGDNLIVTHEPTFFDHLDKPQGLDENDPVWKEKREFIEAHRLVIWRLHDHWHRRTPDGIQAGMTRILGWAHYQIPEDPHRFKLPPTTLRKLAEEVSRKLDQPLLRIVGDPNLPVSGVVMSPGAAGFLRQAGPLQSAEVDVLLAGEAREWETVEYVADAVSQGKKKALILIGHVPSEQAGMEDCAQWLKTFVKSARIEFIATQQPFWTVARGKSAR